MLKTHRVRHDNFINLRVGHLAATTPHQPGTEKGQIRCKIDDELQAYHSAELQNPPLPAR